MTEQFDPGKQVPPNTEYGRVEAFQEWEQREIVRTALAEGEVWPINGSPEKPLFSTKAVEGKKGTAYWTEAYVFDANQIELQERFAATMRDKFASGSFLVGTATFPNTGPVASLTLVQVFL